MRIVLVGDGYPPHPGGLEAHVARLRAALVSRGHIVAVVAPSASNSYLPGEDVTLLRPTASGYLPGQRRVLHPPWVDRAMTAGIARVTRRLKADIIHSHGWVAFSAAAAAARLGIGHVSTLHDYFTCPCRSMYCGDTECSRILGMCCLRCRDSTSSFTQRAGLALAIRLGLRSLVDRTAQFFAVSTHVADVHTRIGLPESKITVAPNFVDAVMPPRVRPPDGSVGFVGVESPHKGFQVLRDAIDLVRSRNPDFQLQVAGIKKPNEPGVIYHGRLEGEDLARFYRSISTIVVPPTWEDPCPTVALEAMASGAIIIGSNVGGLKDIIEDGLTGILVPPNDAVALGVALMKVNSDTGRFRFLGEAGRRRAEENFTTPAVLPLLEAGYKKAA